MDTLGVRLLPLLLLAGFISSSQSSSSSSVSSSVDVPTTIDLYMSENSPPCRAVWMTALALGLGVNIKPTRTGPTGTGSAAFKKMNHNHCIPTIDDDGFILWESRTIMRYLVNKYDTADDLYPKDIHKRAVVERLMDYDATKLYPAISKLAYSVVVLDEEPPPGSAKQLDTIMAELEASPGYWDSDFMTGAVPSLADITTMTSLSFIDTMYYDFTKFPNINAWRQRMMALPYYAPTHIGFDKYKRFVLTEEHKAEAAVRRKRVRGMDNVNKKKAEL